MFSRGEWIAKTTADGFCILAGKTFTAVAERYFDRKPTTAELSELHANARLIAASKELLQVCYGLVKFCESKNRLNDDGICPTATYELAKELIARIEG